MSHAQIRADAIAPEWDAAAQAMFHLSDVESMLGGSNGPTIKVRAYIGQSNEQRRKDLAELGRLRGQQMVLLELLGEAAEVIHNLPDEVETQDEADMLNALKDRIADARGAVLLGLTKP